MPYKDSKLSIYFETEEMMEETLILLRFNCPEEQCVFVAKGWNELKVHVRGVHGRQMWYVDPPYSIIIIYIPLHTVISVLDPKRSSHMSIRYIQTHKYMCIYLLCINDQGGDRRRRKRKRRR